jgi:hypothetical protein
MSTSRGGKKNPWLHVSKGEVVRLYGGMFNGVAVKIIIPDNGIYILQGCHYKITKNSVHGYDGQFISIRP